MQEQKNRRAGFRRPLIWVGAGILALLAGTGAAGYAATDGFTAWPWNMSVGNDGFVTDQDGKVIGISADHEDGSSTTYVEMGKGHIIIEANESLKGRGGIGLHVEP